MATLTTTPASERDHAAVAAQTFEIVRQLLGELGGAQAHAALTPASHLERDLALGSLERVELLLRLGTAFKVHLPDRVVAEADTLEDLVAAVLNAAAAPGAASATDLLSAPLAHVRRPAPSGRGTPDDTRFAESAETLNEVLERRARAHPDRPQVFLRTDDDADSRGPHHVVLTYGELYARCSALADALVARGLGPREAVAIMLPTSTEFFFTFYGVLLAGGVPVPIYPPFRADRIEEYAARQSAILRNAEARILVTFRQAETVARLLKPRVPSLLAVVTAAKLLEPSASAAPAQKYRPRPDDLAFLQYTSGSTSDPKGVMLTHANLLANIRAIIEAVGFTSDDVGTSWLPLYHDMGLIGAWLSLLYAGIPLASMSPLAFLSRPERWLWAVHHHRGTISAAPNFAYELCLRKIADRDIEGLDLSSWRAALNGAEPVNPETLEKFADRFSKYGFRPEAMLPVYGLAEASLAVTVPPLGRRPLVDRVERAAFERDGRAIPVFECGSLPALPALSPPVADEGLPPSYAELSPGIQNSAGSDPSVLPSRNHEIAQSEMLSFVSCGCPVPRHEVLIVDADGRALPERTEGALWFRGPSATRGYFHNPAASKEILRTGGWVDSGDRAYFAGGEVFITGRVKDIIIKAGRNFFPHEIEEVAGSVAGVRKGCVVAFGAADARSGTERMVVVAESRERDPLRKREIAAAVTLKISDAVGLPPDVVEIVPSNSIPKTSSGKLRRSETKKLYLAGKLARRKPPAWVQVARLGARSGAQQVGQTAVGGLRRVIDFVFGVFAIGLFAAFLIPTWAVLFFIRSRATAARITSAALRGFFRLLGWDIRVQGIENLAGTGPRIFVSNHTSYADVLVLLAVLPAEVRFVAKIEVASFPFISSFIRRCGHFAFDRGDRSARLGQVDEMEAAVRSGDSVFVFPEGTFHPAPGVRPFQLGAFKASVTTGAPIVPISLRGVRELLRDETFLPRPPRSSPAITLTILPPLVPDSDPTASDWHEIVRLRDAARAAIARPSGEHLL